MFRTIISKAVRPIAATTAVAGAGATYGYHSDPSIRRQADFWRLTAPIVAHYSYASFRESVDGLNEEEAQVKYYTPLHEKYAPIVLQNILELRGLLIKFGQVLSVRPEFCPKAYLEVFRELQSDVPSEDFELIRQVIEEDLGAPIDTLFSEFDITPIGSASIGQAHTAVLRETNEKVVVKVQYPNVKPEFLADLKSMRYLMLLAEPDAEPAFTQFAEQLETELDYVQEAQNLKEVFEKVLPKFRHSVSIPELKPDYCSDRVITMSYIEGEKLDTTILSQLKSVGIESNGAKDVKSLLATKILENTIEVDDGVETELVDSAIDQEEYIKKQSFMTIAGQIGLRIVKFFGPDVLLSAVRYVQLSKDTALISIASVINCIDYYTGAVGNSLRDWSNSKQENYDRLLAVYGAADKLNLLLDVHGYEIFVAGIFNGDPHPGNILLTPDDKIGLIDYGQCVRINQEQQKKIANLFEILYDKNSTNVQIANAMRNCGIKTINNNDEFLAAMAHVMFSKIEAEFLNPQFHMRLYELDRVIYFPPELAMVARVSGLLRGLALTMQKNISLVESWHSHTSVVLQDEYKK